MGKIVRTESKVKKTLQEGNRGSELPRQAPSGIKKVLGSWRKRRLFVPRGNMIYVPHEADFLHFYSFVLCSFFCLFGDIAILERSGLGEADFRNLMKASSWQCTVRTVLRGGFCEVYALVIFFMFLHFSTDTAMLCF